MNLSEIKSRVLNPEGPVDVEFESVLLALLSTIEKLCAVGTHNSYALQLELCKSLRKGGALLQHKIGVIFGREYRGNTGGQVLLDLAELGLELLESGGGDKKIIGSVQLHFNDIKKANASLPPNRCGSRGQTVPAASSRDAIPAW